MAIESLSRIDHVIFSVRDLNRSLEFYRGTLSFWVLLEEYELEVAWGSANRLSLAVMERNDDVAGMVELVEFTNPRLRVAEPPGYFHTGFSAITWEVRSLDDLYKEWAKRGTEFLRPPTRQNIPRHGTPYTALMKDTDGNRLELVQS